MQLRDSHRVEEITASVGYASVASTGNARHCSTAGQWWDTPTPSSGRRQRAADAPRRAPATCRASRRRARLHRSLRSPLLRVRWPAAPSDRRAHRRRRPTRGRRHPRPDRRTWQRGPPRPRLGGMLAHPRRPRRPRHRPWPSRREPVLYEPNGFARIRFSFSIKGPTHGPAKHNRPRAEDARSACYLPSRAVPPRTDSIQNSALLTNPSERMSETDGLRINSPDDIHS